MFAKGREGTLNNLLRVTDWILFKNWINISSKYNLANFQLYFWAKIESKFNINFRNINFWCIPEWSEQQLFGPNFLPRATKWKSILIFVGIKLSCSCCSQVTAESVTTFLESIWKSSPKSCANLSSFIFASNVSDYSPLASYPGLHGGLISSADQSAKSYPMFLTTFSIMMCQYVWKLTSDCNLCRNSL